MRFGEKCKEKTTKMTEDSPRVTDLINNANFLLNVSVLLIRGFFGKISHKSSNSWRATDSSDQPFPGRLEFRSRIWSPPLIDLLRVSIDQNLTWRITYIKKWIVLLNHWDLTACLLIFHKIISPPALNKMTSTTHKKQFI